MSFTFSFNAVDKERLQYSGMLYMSGTRQKLKFSSNKDKKDNVFHFHFAVTKANKTREMTFFRTGMSPGNVGSTTRYH